MRLTTFRNRIQQLLHRVPFEPFMINLENGDRLTIEHPENIAFDPGDNEHEGSSKFSVISKQLDVYSTFDAVASIALLSTGKSIE